MKKSTCIFRLPIMVSLKTWNTGPVLAIRLRPLLIPSGMVVSMYTSRLRFKNNARYKRREKAKEKKMFARAVWLVVAFSFSLFYAASAQEESGKHESIAVLSQEPEKPAERKDQAGELSKDERAAKLTILPVRADLETVQEHFSSSRNEKVLILLSVTNTSAEPIWITVGDSRIRHRPQLRKDGKLVPYQAKVDKTLRMKEKEGPGAVRVTGTFVEPNQTIRMDYIDLSEWYDTLVPGLYELTLKYHFKHGGRPVETNTVSFEVVP